MSIPLERRLMRKVVQCGDCWEFFGYRDRRGYGRIAGLRRGVDILTHRAAYELLVGPIPDGLELDHLCRNPSCCNPEHLEAVTHQVNVQRGRAGYAIDDRCKHGHDLSDPDNVYTHTRGQAGRKCKTCAKANAMKRYYRMKENTK